jgi:adenylosuccinate lyase
LSDTTVRRSFGIAFGYSYLSWQSVIEALERLTPNPTALENDLSKHWEIFAAPIQNLLRTQGYEKPYELLKEKTRGKTLSRQEMTAIIRSLKLNAATEKQVLGLNPKSLPTVASKLAAKAIAASRKARQ